MFILATDSSICGQLCLRDTETFQLKNNRYGKFILKSHHVIWSIYIL